MNDYPYNFLRDSGIDVSKIDKRGFSERYENTLLKFSERMRSIVLQHYRYDETLDAIAKDYNVTRERVRQTIKKAQKDIKADEAYLLYGFNIKSDEYDLAQVQARYQEISALEQQLILLRQKIYEAKGILFGDYIDNKIVPTGSNIDMEFVKNRFNYISIESLQVNQSIKMKLAKQGIIKVNQLISKTEEQISGLNNRDMALLKKELKIWGASFAKEAQTEVQKPTGQNYVMSSLKEDITLNQLYNRKEISTRSYNGLISTGVYTLSELSLLYVEDIKSIRNLGNKSANEIITDIAHKYNIKLYSREMPLVLPPTFADESLSIATQVYCTKNGIRTPADLIRRHRCDRLTDNNRAIRGDIRYILQKYHIL